MCTGATLRGWDKVFQPSLTPTISQEAPRPVYPKFTIDPSPHLQPVFLKLSPPSSTGAPRTFASKSTFPVQTVPKENFLPFSCFLLDSRDSCTFNALLQLSKAKILSEPIKMVSCSMAQGVPLDGKTFQKDVRPLASLKHSVIPRAKLHTQGH